VPPICVRPSWLPEDKRFFSHPGVDYRVCLGGAEGAAVRSIGEWWRGDRGRDCSCRKGVPRSLSNSFAATSCRTGKPQRTAIRIFHKGLAPPPFLSVVLGASAVKQAAPETGGGSPGPAGSSGRCAEGSDRRNRRSERSSRATPASSISATVATVCRRVEYYFGKALASYTSEDADYAALLAGIGKARGTTLLSPAAGGR